MRDIGADIKRRRKKAKLTQQNLADMMMWSIRKVSNIETNDQDIKAVEYLELIQLLAKISRIAKFKYKKHDGGKSVILATN